jgi:cytochrome c-type biogenesis protein CcmH/NrfG
MRALAAVLTLALLAASTSTPASAQKKGEVPKRPKLQFTTDTNNAAAYYRLGEQTLDRDARQAAAAFYWATRLDPNSAEAFYGLRTALHLADPWRFKRYMEDDRRTIESPEVQHVDSLQARALMLNPFLYRKFDEVMFRSYVHHIANSASPGNERPSPSALDYEISVWLQHGGPETQAWVAYSNGRFADALKYYATAAKNTKRKARLRTERGRLFYLLGNTDSALTELQLALDELRKKDSKELVMLYDSKALLEHSIAKIYEARGDPAAAREAYGRALEEDLAFYPGHFRLANLAFETGDTATGLSEMELAVQIKGDDPVLRLVYGYVLFTAKRYADAEAQLTKAIEVEPYYPNPYYFLGQVHEAQKRPDAAAGQYEAYLARASQYHPHREDATRRLAALRMQAGGPR